MNAEEIDRRNREQQYAAKLDAWLKHLKQGIGICGLLTIINLGWTVAIAIKVGVFK